MRRRSPPLRLLPALLALSAAGAPAAAQSVPVAVSAEALRAHLFAIADDSMGGRATGSRGDALASAWVADQFARAGLRPAGDSGTYFQTLPLGRLALDTAEGIEVGGRLLKAGRDVLPAGVDLTWTVDSAAVIFGGVTDDSATWPSAEQCAGKLVVMRPPPGADYNATMHSILLLRRSPRFRRVAGFAVAALGEAPSWLVERLVGGHLTTDTLAFHLLRGSELVTAEGASTLLGAPLDDAVSGQTGPTIRAHIVFRWFAMPYPVRNVVGVLPGRDSALRDTYVSLSAHHDHLGLHLPPLDHDSVRAFDRVLRPMGEDSPPREPTPSEAARIAALLDSLRAAGPDHQDSVYNGADDDGSGTVALAELARVLAAGPRPRRSILFVSHAAEELGLVGSHWYTDHPTVPRDSIVAEIDMDMIGRGDAGDLPGGGPGYLEVVGSRRRSSEFGNLLDTVAAHEPAPFHLNYAYDTPGNPLQYYCRADHYSYARYGIPSVSLSTGEHLDYHEVTDEARYVDFAQLARVTTLVRDLALAVADLDHRPVPDGPRPNPSAPCRQ
jgi:peptidase M28-like protein